MKYNQNLFLFKNKLKKEIFLLICQKKEIKSYIKLLKKIIDLQENLLMLNLQLELKINGNNIIKLLKQDKDFLHIFNKEN